MREMNANGRIYSEEAMRTTLHEYLQGKSWDDVDIDWDHVCRDERKPTQKSSPKKEPVTINPMYLLIS